MRHGKKVNHLGRTSSHRKALLMNLANALITHKRIKTTVAKAKSLRIYVEPLLNRGKVDTTHNRRIVFSYLQQKEVITELFGPVAAKIGDRAGGYTRIIRLGERYGDAAEMAMIELVDFNELLLGDKKEAGAKKKRTRRSGKGADTAAPAKPAAKKEAAPAKVEDTAPEEVVEETPVAEVVETAPAAEETVAEAPAAEEAQAPEAAEEDTTKEE
jgi:large subunit ribosomal protein L17